MVRVYYFSPYGIFWPWDILLCKMPIHISCLLLLIGLSVFFLLIYTSFLYILDVSHLLVLDETNTFSPSMAFFFHSPYGVFWWERCLMSFCLCIPFPLHILKKHPGKCGCLLFFSRMQSFLWVYSGFNQHRHVNFSSWIALKQNYFLLPLPLAYIRFFFPLIFKRLSHWLFGPVFRPWSQKIQCFKEKQVFLLNFSS